MQVQLEGPKITLAPPPICHESICGIMAESWTVRYEETQAFLYPPAFTVYLVPSAPGTRVMDGFKPPYGYS